MSRSTPTVYRTLMDEAIAQAESFREEFMSSSGLEELVAPAVWQNVRDTLRHAFRTAYTQGLVHGYQQAAQAFDERQRTEQKGEYEGEGPDE